MKQGIVVVGVEMANKQIDKENQSKECNELARSRVEGCGYLKRIEANGDVQGSLYITDRDRPSNCTLTVCPWSFHPPQTALPTFFPVFPSPPPAFCFFFKFKKNKHCNSPLLTRSPSLYQR